MVRHFLSFDDFTSVEVDAILSNAHALKKEWVAKRSHSFNLKGRNLAMLFESNSTRTRISFEVAMNQLGGHALNLSTDMLQLSRGELDKDSARVISSMCDLIMIRTKDHNRLLRFAEYSNTPIINGLSNLYHPCQVLSDFMTIEEVFGSYKNKIICWLGDVNNMLFTLINAVSVLDIKLKIATSSELIKKHKLTNYDAAIFTNALEAVAGADIIMTDTWTSMHDDSNNFPQKKKMLSPYMVNETIMNHVKQSTIFMHCLPAKRGEETTDQALEGKWSKVWLQAENRLHCQKSLICFLLNMF